MWKPWILIGIGSILIADAAAKGFAPADSIAAYNEDSNFSTVDY
jgi:hypothetical protein